MSKVNLLNLPQRERPAHTRTFTDPLYPESPVTLTCRRLRTPEKMLALDEATEMLSEFEEGFTDLNGDLIPLSPSLCQSVTILARMQCGSDAERYTAQELLGLFQHMDTVSQEVLLWVAEIEGVAPLGEKAQAEPGNSSGAAGKP